MLVLVGIDDSPRSEDAVALARRLGDRVLLVHAYPFGDEPNRPVSIVYKEALERDARALAERLGADLDVRILADWSPSRALHRLAAEEGAGLIVVGSTHTDHAGRIAPGATAERLLHGSPCPVAVAPDGYRLGSAPIERVGVGYDGSDEASAAVELARGYGGELELVRVWPSERYAMLGAHDDLLGATRADLEACAARLDATPVLLDGDPAHELVERSRSLDLIVLGSRGYGPLRAVLVGGVSGRVAREAHCPVIVVPRGVLSAAPA